MKLKDKINHYIDTDPMGPLLIPMGMLGIAMIFLFLLFGATYAYDTWYNDKYVTEVSRSEPADGIVTEYGTRTEVGYKPIYEKVRRSNGKTSWWTEQKVGEEKITTIHKYIKFEVYSNIDNSYYESGWQEVGWKMKPGYVYGTFQVVTYYDSHKDKAWTELEKYVGD